jgi:hypothetical protein
LVHARLAAARRAELQTQLRNSVSAEEWSQFQAEGALLTGTDALQVAIDVGGGSLAAES